MTTWHSSNETMGCIVKQNIPKVGRCTNIGKSTVHKLVHGEEEVCVCEQGYTTLSKYT